MTESQTITGADVGAAPAGLTEETKVAKSIVPAKYAGKYKDGASDALAVFINKECKGEAGFYYAKFFKLCRVNGIPEDKVAHYEAQVAEKRNGSQGRARMTLRNMIATLVRKNKSIKDLGGEDHEIDSPKPVLSGAAKAQAEKEVATN